MPNYYGSYPQMYYQNANVANVTPATSQTQNGFVSVPSEEFARNYPVGYGNSVNFKDEHAPYIYVKTMGLSQFDNPVFEKYRLVKEPTAETPNSPQNDKFDIQSTIQSIEKINSEIEAIWAEIDALKNAKEKSVARSGNSKRNKDGDDGHDEQSE